MPGKRARRDAQAGAADMISVIQRVRHARVVVDSEVVGKIGKGFLVLLGECS